MSEILEPWASQPFALLPLASSTQQTFAKSGMDSCSSLHRDYGLSEHLNVSESSSADTIRQWISTLDACLNNPGAFKISSASRLVHQTSSIGILQQGAKGPCLNFPGGFCSLKNHHLMLNQHKPERLSMGCDRLLYIFVTC